MNEYTDHYTTLNADEIQRIKQNYKIIDVNHFNIDLVKFKMITDNYFEKNSNKIEVVNNMLHYYSNSKDAKIYKKTDYLCNEKEKICICNIYADSFRRIYDGLHYDKDTKYISWIRKIGERF